MLVVVVGILSHLRVLPRLQIRNVPRATRRVSLPHKGFTQVLSLPNCGTCSIQLFFLYLYDKSAMDNPHSERQAVLLERIVKNVVRCNYSTRLSSIIFIFQNKCVELMAELNHCVEVCFSWYFTSLCCLQSAQETSRANVDIKNAADLVTKYRKNAQYNLDATGVQKDV